MISTDDIFNTRFILLLIQVILFISRAIKLTGPFVTMIFSMITGDMFTFSMIYIIFLFGFSQSFYFLQYNIENADLYGDYHSTYVGLFQMTLGEYEVSKIRGLKHAGCFIVIWFENICRLRVKPKNPVLC